MIDKIAVCNSFSKAAIRYDTLALFQRQINEKMFCLLSKRLPRGFSPNRILDAGCGTGFSIQYLKGLWPEANIIGCDLSLDMLNIAQHKQLGVVVGDIENLPFLTETFDFVWSSLSLQWCSPKRAFSELFRIMAPGSMLFFSTLAPGTLKEIRYAFSMFDDTGNMLVFSERADLESILAEHGFQNINLWQKTYQIFYPDIYSVLLSIRGIGAGYIQQQRPSLFGKNAWEIVQKRYETFREKEGLPITYETIIGSVFR